MRLTPTIVRSIRNSPDVDVEPHTPAIRYCVSTGTAAIPVVVAQTERPKPNPVTCLIGRGNLANSAQNFGLRCGAAIPLVPGVRFPLAPKRLFFLFCASGGLSIAV